MSGQIFCHAHRVTYAECTIGNHVYYARYLDMLEAARGEFFRHLGQPFQYWLEHGAIFPVVECRLRYKGAARYDDLLTVELWLTEAAKIRFQFEYRVLSQSGRVLLEGATEHVCTSIDEKPKRLPEELLEALRRYLHES